MLTLALWAVLAFPWAARAQETTLGGTVADSTGAVLPGVTVTATHVDTGNTFLGVSNERGEYRVGPLRPGIYTVSLELPGFATVTREGLELLLGQRAAINFEMKPSTLEETVTVTAEAPLVDISRTRMGGNIDRRQMEELPVNGRNWMDLSMLAPGAKTNHVDESPTQGMAGRGTDSKSFHLNLDGQQVTNTVSTAGFGQPRYSRDLVAEFELVTNRFDATQGRSMLSHVNAITKSGTNAFVGSLSGYFRDDSLNAKDFIVGRVLPYSNQQISGTFGGPIKRDRMHFFANHEYAREPQAFTFTTPWPQFNLNVFDDSVKKENMGGVRIDNQFSVNRRLMTRYHGYTADLPNDPRNTGGATRHPSSSARTERVSYQLFGVFTEVLRPSVIHELRGGYSRFRFQSEGVVPHTPTIQLRGLTIGEPTNYVQNIPQDVYQGSSQWTLIRGRHELKLGGEALFTETCLCPWEHIADGSINATGGPVPANIEALFPVWNDPSTWNLAALSSITLNVQASVGTYSWADRKAIAGAYVQDNWRITDNLTLNLGVRYDLSVGAKSEQHTFEPFLPEPRPTEKLNFQPRGGFAYSFDDRQTVIRGGFGKYFGELTQLQAYSLSITRNAAGVLIPNDGRPDFAANWWNGPKPTYQQALTYPNRNIIFQIPDGEFMSPYSWQTSIGMQRQLGETMSVQTDYVYAGVRRELTSRNANLSYNPVTGANNSYLIVASRPYPDWGSVITQYSDAWGDSHSIETALTKRFSRRWQASATYALGWLKNAEGAPTGPCWTAATGFTPCPSGFAAPRDLGGDYAYAEGDQRHRAVFNGIWQLPYAFQVSGLYFFGSGQRFATSYGADLRLTGPGSGGRLRADGSIMPRNALVGRPVHRVDLRMQRGFDLGGRRKIDGIVEVFNVFNHANYGAYTTVETNRNYGQPAQNTNVAYQPRMMQLGFRLTF